MNQTTDNSSYEYGFPVSGFRRQWAIARYLRRHAVPFSFTANRRQLPIVTRVLRVRGTTQEIETFLEWLQQRDAVFDGFRQDFADQVGRSHVDHEGLS